MKTRLKLTDRQFEALDADTRRSMIYQLWKYAGEVDKDSLTVVDKWL